MKNKLSIFITIFVLVFGIQLTQPEQAYAVDADDAQNTTNWITNILNTGENVWGTISKEVLEPAVQALANKVLDKMVQSTLNWAAGGFDGEPGFINNWDDFLKDTEYSVINSAFQSASLVAQQSQLNADFSNIQEVTECMIAIPYEAGSEAECNDLHSGGTPEDCSIYDFDTQNDEYEECEELNSILEDSESFLEDCISEIPAYNAAAQECNAIQGNSTASALGNAAASNYGLWQSGEAFTSRSVAATIAKSGQKTLNGNDVDAVISGEGNTLKKLLGSQQKVNQFKTDITSSGFDGYVNGLLALTNPESYDSGLNSKVKEVISKETVTKVNKVVQNVQTPQKFLDKKSCSNGGEPVDGKCPGENNKLISQTPGQQVGSLVVKGLTKESDQAGDAKGLVGSLVGALGKLTAGLIDQGINKVAKVAVESFFGSGEQETFSAGGNEYLNANYQSEYDILGITSDNVSSGSSSNSGGQNSDDLFASNDGQAPFLGGPEDTVGNWDQGPQVVIDFNELLQANINFASQEFEYYKQMEQIIIDTKDSAIAMDQCLPGPDYGWENRWGDKMSSSDESDLGLTLTKKMFADSRVNIPGSKHIYSSFIDLVGSSKIEAAKTQFRLDNLNKVISTLDYIEAEISGRFRIQRSVISDDLVLFEKDWNLLSEEKQRGLLSIAIDNTFYILKEEQGETIETAIANNNNKARDAVLNMAWDLWRTETPQEEKNDLRYSYFILQSKLSSEQFLASAKAKLAQVRGAAQSSRELLSDCLVFKAFALGTPKSELEAVINNNIVADGPTALANIESQLQAMSQTLNETAGAFFLGGPFGQAIGGAISVALFGGGDDEIEDSYTYMDINPHPSDQDIIDFLVEQNELGILNDENALFNSTKMTSGGAISQSILGFESEADKETYFDERYPDLGENIVIGDNFGGAGGTSGNYPAKTRTNAFSIYEIFRQDTYNVWVFGGDDDSDITGQISTLFCQHNGGFGTGATGGSSIGGFGGRDNVTHSECIRGGWSKTTELQYELIFAGVQ